MIRTYEGMMKLETLEERFDYLKLWDTPHVPPDDEIYRRFLKSPIWLSTREDILERDLIQDLGIVGKFSNELTIVHHIDPITTSDIINENWDKLINPNNLITTSITTHNAIHYKQIIRPEVVFERTPGDTTLW